MASAASAPVHDRLHVTIGVPAFLLALARSSGPWRRERFSASVARFAVPAGLAVGIGIVAGYLLARYELNLGLGRSCTVASGIAVICGLAVVMRLEAEPGRRRLAVGGLCAVMALLFARDPHPARLLRALNPDRRIVAAWALGSVLGVGGMLGALRLLPV